MRLRAGLHVMRRDRGEVQVGADPRWAVRLTDLTPAEVDLLLALRAGADVALPDQGRHLSTLLTGARLVADDDRPVVPGPAGADAAVWSLLLAGGGGSARVRQRASSCVGVVGLGPTGLGTALALAAAGVGTLLLDDERPVRSVDVGVGGYRWSHVGTPREAAAARVLRDIAPHVRLGPGQDDDGRSGGATPDVLVVVESGAADPERGQLLVGLGVPHLSVVIREGDAVVGPLVVPGAGPCLRCLDLHRADVDPAWPAVLGELVGPAPADEVGVVAAVCAGLAAAAVLGVVDGDRPTAGRTYEVGLPDAVPRARDWPVHPLCGCTGLPGPADGQAAG